jgi:hypothetical protein
LDKSLYCVSVAYLLSILIETPVLIVGLSARHPLRRRVIAGVWLTACTYPIVGVVLPSLIDPVRDRGVLLGVAETFAPVAECALFWLAFGDRSAWGRRSMYRDFAAITAANLASFLVGEALLYQTVTPFFTRSPSL